MKKHVSFLLASVLCFNSSFEMSRAMSFSANAAETVSINSASDLVMFASRVNKGEETLNAILTNDIDLSSVCNETIDWTPIGGSRSSIPASRSYQGVFDGAGHTITGLQMSSGDSNAGLFGTSSGTIKNLNIEVNIRSSKNSSTVGAICGHNYGGAIVNCSSKGYIQGGISIGGICGSNTSGPEQSYSTGTIENCKNYATVTGIKIDNEALGSNIGGICGNSKLSLGIRKCSNFGAVSGVENVGGICGEADEIWGCFNTANISGMYQIIMGVSEITGNSVGGIVGKCVQGFSTIRSTPMLHSNYNLGNICGAWMIGGIAGSSFSGTIIDSYSVGIVNSTGSNAGGIIGSSNGTVNNCFYKTGCAKDGNGTTQKGIGKDLMGYAQADDYISSNPITDLSHLASKLNNNTNDWIDNEEVKHPILICNPEVEIQISPDSTSTTSTVPTNTIPAATTSTTMSKSEFEAYMKSQFDKWTVGSGIQRNTLSFTDNFVCTFIVSISSSKVNAELIVSPDFSGYQLKLDTSRYDYSLPSQIVSIVTAINGVVLNNQHHGAWNTRMVTVPQENPNKKFVSYATESSDAHKWEIYTETGDGNQQPYYVNCWDESLVSTSTTSATTTTTTTASATTTTATAITTSATTTTSTTTTASTIPQPEYLFGDVDCNGEVNANDAQIALMAYIYQLAGKPNGLTERQERIADVDENGTITADDAQYILIFAVSKLAGLNPQWNEIIKK